jgi:hypothetical protein
VARDPFPGCPVSIRLDQAVSRALATEPAKGFEEVPAFMRVLVSSRDQNASCLGKEHSPQGSHSWESAARARSPWR